MTLDQYHTTLPGRLPLPPAAAIPPRFGKLLLQYCDVRADSRGSELLMLRKAVGEHLRQILSEAGYITVAPHLGFFAGRHADGPIAIVARPKRQTFLH